MTAATVPAPAVATITTAATATTATTATAAIVFLAQFGNDQLPLTSIRFTGSLEQ